MYYCALYILVTNQIIQHIILYVIQFLNLYNIMLFNWSIIIVGVIIFAIKINNYFEYNKLARLIIVIVIIMINNIERHQPYYKTSIGLILES